jgi:hypothetical protein
VCRVSPAVHHGAGNGDLIAGDEATLRIIAAAHGRGDECPRPEKARVICYRGVRRQRVTTLAEAGCTLPDIVPITAHTLRQARYIRAGYRARMSKLAPSDIAEFENIIETESAKRLEK